jgi:hypothetical protein
MSSSANAFFGGGTGQTLTNLTAPGQPFQVGDQFQIVIQGPPGLAVTGGWPVSMTDPGQKGTTDATGTWSTTGTMQTAGTFGFQWYVAGGGAYPQMVTVNPAPAPAAPTPVVAPVIVPPITPAVAAQITPVPSGVVQQMPNAYCTPPNCPIIDGFLYRTDLKCDLTFLALAVNAFEALRRSSAYRQRAWCVPQDSNAFLIPARDSYEFQVRMKPGSAIWGYTFTGSGSVIVANGEITREILSFQVRDSCTDVPLFSEVATKPISAAVNLQQLLAKLMIVPEPGLLHVEITNTFSTPQTAQLILYGGEPVCV